MFTHTMTREEKIAEANADLAHLVLKVVREDIQGSLRQMERKRSRNLSNKERKNLRLELIVKYRSP